MGFGMGKGPVLFGGLPQESRHSSKMILKQPTIATRLTISLAIKTARRKNPLTASVVTVATAERLLLIRNEQWDEPDPDTRCLTNFVGG